MARAIQRHMICWVLRFSPQKSSDYFRVFWTLEGLLESLVNGRSFFHELSDVVQLDYKTLYTMNYTGAVRAAVVKLRKIREQEKSEAQRSE